MSERILWEADDLRIKNEPLIKSLLTYRLYEDRRPVPPFPEWYQQANLVSSLTWDGKQLPILDLDADHLVVQSTTEGHHHLFINVPMGRLKWTVLMLVLWWTGVVEMGNAVWSLRRGANFVRMPGAIKTEEEAAKPDYGWLFKLK